MKIGNYKEMKIISGKDISAEYARKAAFWKHNKKPKIIR